MEDNKGLTVIEGGKGKKKGTRHGHQAMGTGLTEKQERFARLLSEGSTNAEAYRAAYEAGNMAANTVYSEACKLAANPKIAARLNALLSEKKAKHGMLSEKQGDRVWRNVWRLAEGESVPPSVQQAALALAAKMAGMLTDQVRMETVTTDSKSIEAEILERLQRLSA
jgi:phage terminase small subunit